MDVKMFYFTCNYGPISLKFQARLSLTKQPPSDVQCGDAILDTP